MKVSLKVLCIGVTCFHITVTLENLAQNMMYKGEASQSSVHLDNWAAADKAIDGHIQEEKGKDFCSFTKSSVYKTAWWKFTLLHQSNVAYLLLFFRKSTVNRHTGFSVFVFNESLYIPPSTGGYKVFTQNPSSCPKQVMNVTINKVTKGIAVFNTKNPPLNTSCEGYAPSYTTIEICEIMVMGCHFQQYGEKRTSCSVKCLNKECDAFNGSCIYGCSNRLMAPPDCTQCQDHKYRPNCVFNCGHCKDGKPCSKINGTCVRGCDAGWSGSLCLKVTPSPGDLHSDQDISKTSSVIISIFSTLVAVSFISVGVLIVYKRRKLRTMHSGKDQTDKIPSESVENPKLYDRVAVKIDKQAYDNINL